MTKHLWFLLSTVLQGPALSVIRTVEELPPLESSHLPNKGRQGSSPDPFNFRVGFSMVLDGTMAIEVQLAHALLQWPYLTDMSIVSAIVSVFVPTWGGPPSTLEQVLQLKRTPWLYFNLVVKDSQVGVPLG